MALKLPIRYGGTFITDEERQITHAALDKSFDTGQWQTASEAKAFEEETASYLGMKYGVITTSGSAAGLLALAALELPPKSEVIIPAVTFPTIFNIILQCNLTPVVVDCEVGTYNFDMVKLARAITKKTKAIIAVHAVGNPVDMPRLMRMVDGKEIWVIEDNCDGWGGEINGQKVGSFGDISISSFHAAHIISTAGTGGGIYTNSEKIANNVRQYRDWGRQADTVNPHKVKSLPKDYNPRFVYDKIGYNLQILELQAAMGRVQLKKIDEIKKLRKANFDYYVEHLKPYHQLIMPRSPEGADPCWFAFPLTYIGKRGDLVAHLEKNQIETRSMFAGNIIKHPAYVNAKYKVSGTLEGADDILRQSFWIGLHPRMTQEDREYVIRTFDSFFNATDD